MIKRIICTECPKGCELFVNLDERGNVVRVSGNTCPKGIPYAHREIKCPQRIITSTVAAKGLSVKMIPVRTTSAISKEKLREAMARIKSITIDTPVTVGYCIEKDFMVEGVDLVASRTVS